MELKFNKGFKNLSGAVVRVFRTLIPDQFVVHFPHKIGHRYQYWIYQFEQFQEWVDEKMTGTHFEVWIEQRQNDDGTEREPDNVQTAIFDCKELRGKNWEAIYLYRSKENDCFLLLPKGRTGGGEWYEKHGNFNESNWEVEE